MSLQSGYKQFLWSGIGALLSALWFVLLNGWRPLWIIFTAAAAHECGHWLTLRLLHMPVTSFSITLFGMEMKTQGSRMSYPGEIAAVLAGPAVNLLGGILLLCLPWGGICEKLAGANFALAMFNLLPIRPLDGGHFLELLITWISSPNYAEQIMGQVELLLGLVAASLLLWTVFQTRGNLWLLPPVVFLLHPAARTLKRARRG